MRLPTKLVVLGDSIALGVGSGASGGIVPLLANGMGIPSAGLVNAAQEGARSVSLAGQLDYAGDCSPDLLLVSCGVNDAMAQNEPTGFVVDFDSLLYRVDQATPVVIIGIPPLSPHLRISQVRRRRVETRMNELDEYLRHLSNRPRVTYFDSRALPAVTDAAMWNADGLHLSPRGYEHVAHHLVRTCRQVLTSDSRRG